MPLVCKPSAFTCRAERLARAAASPHGSIIRPSGNGQGDGPPANSGKEMTLHVSGEFVGSDILDAPFVYVAGRKMASVDQVAQPLGGVGVDLVVVSARDHAALASAPLLKTSTSPPTSSYSFRSICMRRASMS